MAFREYNPHPYGYRIDDCSVRSLTKALDMDWDQAYMALAMYGFATKRMMDGKETMGDFLMERGWKRYALPDTCPRCYTVAQFADDHPRGTFVLGTSSHILTVYNGDWYDTWDSRDEVPLFVWVKEKEKHDVE